MNMEQAAKIGAKWWTDQLRAKSKQNSGDPLTSMMASWAENEIRKINPLTTEKLDVFQSCLESSLLAFIQDTEWLEENPQWGSALRTVGTDYNPDSILGSAAARADISKLHFPVKTLMWLDPDSVKVLLGCDGKIEEIKLENTENRKNIQAEMDWQEIE